MARRPAIFLDRDGTMVHDVGYLSRREDLRWYPFTIDAIRLLRRHPMILFGDGDLRESDARGDVRLRRRERRAD